MKREYAQHSTERKKPPERNKDEEGEERREENKKKKENKKEQIGKFVKTQECNVLTKYDISGFK